jgi:hypothetical protein
MGKGMRFFLALALILGHFMAIPSASADQLAPCRIKASSNQVVSLGFPLRSERLAKLSNAKILVMPFKIKDNPSYIFTDDRKSDYKVAGDNIARLSNGKARVEFIFAPTISTEITNDDLNQLRNNQRDSFQRDESKSTYGFIRKFITDFDPQIDYTGIDAIVIEGSSFLTGIAIAEAFMFWKNPENPWFRPISTGEGEINNVVLFDRRATSQLITHEILHLYGLIDLYGNDSGPDTLSLMASNEVNLLLHEKWVLGWHPDSDVVCVGDISTSNIAEFSFDNSKRPQMAVIRSPSGRDYLLEKFWAGENMLAFYTLDNEARPPIKMFSELNGRFKGVLLLDSYKSIGAQMVSPELTLLVTNFTESTITFNIAPAVLTSTNQFTNLLDKASATKAEIKDRLAAQAKVEVQPKKVNQSKATAKKKTTITCIKGKMVKKITAVKPKCPAGYR